MSATTTSTDDVRARIQELTERIRVKMQSKPALNLGCPCCGLKKVNTSEIGHWASIFQDSLRSVSPNPRAISTLQVTWIQFDTALRNTSQALSYRSLDLRMADCTYQLLKSFAKIVLDGLFAPDITNACIPSCSPHWVVLLTLMQICYIFRNKLEVNEIVDLYKVYREKPEGFGVDDKVGYENGTPVPLFILQRFYVLLTHDWKNIKKRDMMWELWCEIDPEEHIEGVGNRVVWLPKEMVEDVMSFLVVKLDDEHQPEVTIKETRE